MTSGPGGSRSPNAFEANKPGTAARTDAEEAIERLRQQGGFFVEAVRATRMPMALTDPNLPGNPIVFANRSFLELSGYAIDEILGQQPHFMDGPGTDPHDATLFRQALEEDRDAVVESIQYRKDGSSFVAMVLLSAFKNESGQTLHHFLSWQDVSRRVAAEDRVGTLRDAEARLRQSEQRHAFLLALADRLRPLADPHAIQAEAARLLGEHLGTEGAGYYEVAPHNGALAVGRDGHRAGERTSSPDEWPISLCADGRTCVMHDITADAAKSPGEQRQFFLGADIGALIAVPLIKNGELLAVFLTHQRAPRSWTAPEIQLVEEVAERTWAAVVQARAEAASRASEERYRTLFESMDEAYAVVEVLKDPAGVWADFRFLDVNPAFMAHTSMPYPVGRTATDLLQTPNPRWAQMYGQVLDTGKALRVEESEETLGRTFDLNIFALDPAHGRVAVLFTDITDRKRREAELRALAERNTEILESISDAFYAVDRDWRFTYVNRQAEQWWGRSRETLLGRIYWDEFPQAVDSIPFQAHQRAAGGREVVRLEALSPILQRWVEITIYPAADGGLSVYFRDITSRKEAEDRQRLLLAELQHRVRNILAMIRSISKRSAETSDNVQDYWQHLDGRISTMARTQGLLTRNVGAGADLQNLILDELTAQAAQPGQVEVTGPDISLPPKAAEVLSLAIHELTTNSIKYGALSARDGRIDVRWAILDGGPIPRLGLLWTEFGVAIEATPRRRGFGTELITERVPYELQGIGSIEFTNHGVVASLEFPLVDAPSVLQTDFDLPRADR